MCVEELIRHTKYPIWMAFSTSPLQALERKITFKPAKNAETRSLPSHKYRIVQLGNRLQLLTLHSGFLPLAQLESKNFQSHILLLLPKMRANTDHIRVADTNQRKVRFGAAGLLQCPQCSKFSVVPELLELVVFEQIDQTFRNVVAVVGNVIISALSNEK